jgi:hypothetical protein
MHSVFIFRRNIWSMHVPPNVVGNADGWCMSPNSSASQRRYSRCLVTVWRDSLPVCARTRSYSYAFPYCGTVSHPYFPSAHRSQRCYHVKKNSRESLIWNSEREEKNMGDILMEGRILLKWTWREKSWCRYGLCTCEFFWIRLGIFGYHKGKIWLEKLKNYQFLWNYFPENQFLNSVKFRKENLCRVSMDVFRYLTFSKSGIWRLSRKGNKTLILNKKSMRT